MRVLGAALPSAATLPPTAGRRAPALRSHQDHRAVELRRACQPPVGSDQLAFQGGAGAGVADEGWARPSPRSRG